MIVRFIAVHEVEELHKRTITQHGGSRGLRDRGLLASSVAPGKPGQLCARSLGCAACSNTCLGLVKNHAFIDGNKRIGLAALLVFLRINDHRLNSTEDEARDMVLKVAAGETGEEEWTAWVVGAAQPRP